MKAVMWTDSFQIITMFAGLIAILVRGSLDFGGFSNIWKINERGGRVEFSKLVRIIRKCLNNLRVFF